MCMLAAGARWGGVRLRQSYRPSACRSRARCGGGDCLCNVLHAAGWNVTREFYYNDAGAQIDNLTLSVQLRCKGLTPDDPSWPESGYRGDYIMDVARSYMAKETVEADDQHTTGKGDVNDAEAIRHFAVAYLRREQDLDLRAFQVEFDVFSLESALYTEGKVEETVQKLIASGHTYEQDGALWLRTTDFGDDKDRVMRKTEAATPTSCRTWPIIWTSGGAVSSASLTSRVPIITPLSRGCARACRRWMRAYRKAGRTMCCTRW